MPATDRASLLARLEAASRATKLVHGGVRYLAKGTLAMVRDALHERKALQRNAPHLSSPLAFVMPACRRMKPWYYSVDLAEGGAFILREDGRYLARAPRGEDVSSGWIRLPPLVHPSGDAGGDTPQAETGVDPQLAGFEALAADYASRPT